MDREKINTGRQYNLDLLKALAIAAMIICHTVIMLSEARSGYESEFGYLFADVFLGSYLAVAYFEYHGSLLLKCNLYVIKGFIVS